MPERQPIPTIFLNTTFDREEIFIPPELEPITLANSTIPAAKVAIDTGEMFDAFFNMRAPGDQEDHIRTFVGTHSLDYAESALQYSLNFITDDSSLVSATEIKRVISEAENLPKYQQELKDAFDVSRLIFGLMRTSSPSYPRNFAQMLDWLISIRSVTRGISSGKIKPTETIRDNADLRKAFPFFLTASQSLPKLILNH